MILPRPPELSSPIHNFCALATFRVGNALTLQYLLVTFPQRKIFRIHTTHGGTANPHNVVRC